MSNTRLWKIFMLPLGAGLAMIGAMLLVIVALGDVRSGFPAMLAAGSGFLLLSLPCPAFLHSSQKAGQLATLVLPVFALGMLVLTFLPSNPMAHPARYQIGAIALAVLSIARAVLSLRRARMQMVSPG